MRLRYTLSHTVQLIQLQFIIPFGVVNIHLYSRNYGYGMGVAYNHK